MQRIFNSLLGLSLVFMLIFTTGCGEEGTGNGNGNEPLPPTLSLASGDNLVSTDASIPLTTGSFSVRIDLNDGDNSLKTLTITEDGSTIPATNLEFDGGNTTAQNPFLILGADQSGTSYDVKITPSDLVANQSRLYTFTVSDTENQTASFSVNVTFTAAPPVVTFGAAGLQSDTELSTNAGAFSIQVLANSTDSQLASIAFYEDGVLINADNVTTGGSALATNPELIIPNAANLDQVYTISPASISEGTRTYSVELKDALGGVSSQAIVITYVAPTVTVLTGILLNAAGPTGTGGLDLDNGQGTGSNDAAAEIKDEGIDLGAPSNATNWKQQISATNDAELRALTPGNMPDGFVFNNVNNQSEVIAAFDAAEPITVSNTILQGDMFAVKRGSNYYLVRVDNVTVTTNDNNDSYELSIIK